MLAPPTPPSSCKLLAPRPIRPHLRPKVLSTPSSSTEGERFWALSVPMARAPATLGYDAYFHTPKGEMELEQILLLSRAQDPLLPAFTPPGAAAAPSSQAVLWATCGVVGISVVWLAISLGAQSPVQLAVAAGLALVPTACLLSPKL